MYLTGKSTLDDNCMCKANEVVKLCLKKLNKNTPKSLNLKKRALNLLMALNKTAILLLYKVF